jgi:hypothetical protein
VKRFRIDFSIREADVPPEDARGIRFGDEVDADKIFDFFNRCRDAALMLFNGGKRPPTENEWEVLKQEAERLRKLAGRGHGIKMHYQADRRVTGVTNNPYDVDNPHDLIKMWGGSGPAIKG